MGTVHGPATGSSAALATEVESKMRTVSHRWGTDAPRSENPFLICGNPRSSARSAAALLFSLWSPCSLWRSNFLLLPPMLIPHRHHRPQNIIPRLRLAHHLVRKHA